MNPGLRELLDRRARIVAAVRAFFRSRQVTEVETPALSVAATTDPALASMTIDLNSSARRHFLATSPEHAMKRLLAGGSGDIFQIARVFRDDESGRWHQPEFLMLEWYRVGFDEFALMDEVFDLLEHVLADDRRPLARLDLTYADAFLTALDVDPHRLDGPTADRLIQALSARGIDVPAGLTANALLDLALSTVVVPGWPWDCAVFLHDYPAAQAALARIRGSDPPVGARFEVFVNGIELGNGFDELTDASEQRRRFEAELAARRARALPDVPIDEELLAALESGLPACAGVAVGLDRLIALALGASSLAEVVPLAHGKRGQENGVRPHSVRV